MNADILTIAQTAEDLDLHYTMHDGDIHLPGYWRVYYDDQPGVEPGLVAEGLDGDGQPVDVDEVVDELRSI